MPGKVRMYLDSPNLASEDYNAHPALGNTVKTVSGIVGKEELMKPYTQTILVYGIWNNICL